MATNAPSHLRRHTVSKSMWIFQKSSVTEGTRKTWRVCLLVHLLLYGPLVGESWYCTLISSRHRGIGVCSTDKRIQFVERGGGRVQIITIGQLATKDCHFGIGMNGWIIGVFYFGRDGRYGLHDLSFCNLTSWQATDKTSLSSSLLSLTSLYSKVNCSHIAGGRRWWSQNQIMECRGDFGGEFLVVCCMAFTGCCFILRSCDREEGTLCLW